MSDKSFTFFEFHFHDRFQFGPGEIGRLGGSTNELVAADEDDAPADDDQQTVSDEDEQTVSDEGDASGPCLVCRLVGLGVLAAAAYAVRKLLSGEPSGLDALDDIEAGAEDDASGGTAETEDSVSIEVTSGEEAKSATGSKGLAAGAVLALLVVLAFVVRKLLGDTVEELEVPDELAEE